MKQSFTNLDVVEKVLFVLNSELRLKLRVNVSQKNGRTGERMPADYFRNYASKRFTNKPEMDEYHLNTNEYLILSLFKNQSDGQFLNEDVFISYPHLTTLRATFIRWIRDVRDNEELFIYGDDGSLDMNEAQADELTYQVDNLPGESVIAIRPAIHTTTDNYIEEGIEIFINSYEISTVVSLDSFITMTHVILKDFDLLNSSLQLVNIAMTNQLLNAMAEGMAMGGGVNSSPSPRSNGGGRVRGGKAPIRRGGSKVNIPKRRRTVKKEDPALNEPFPNAEDLSNKNPITGETIQMNENPLEETQFDPNDVFASNASKKVKAEEPEEVVEEAPTGNLLAGSLGDIQKRSEKIKEELKEDEGSSMIESGVTLDDIDNLE